MRSTAVIYFLAFVLVAAMLCIVLPLGLQYGWFQ